MKHLALLICALLASAAALAQPTLDAQALQAIAATNDRTAHALELGTCAAERSAVVASAQGCTDTVCRISIAAIAALTPCAAQRVGGVVQAQAVAPPQQIVVQREVSVAERVVGLFAGGIGKIFDTAIAVAPSLLNYKLGLAQSMNSTTLGVAQSNNALAAQQSSNNTFAAFGGQIASTASSGFAATTALGNNIQGTASSGFFAMGNLANANTAAARDTSIAAFGALRDVGLKPTTTITGDSNNIITGTGNTTQSGTGNRQGSSGPCTAGNGGNPTATTTPGTAPASTTAALPPGTVTATPTTTGGSSDCGK